MNTKYQVIQFSPVPEQAEFINVALLLHDGPRIIYDKSFPKLGCIESGFNKTLLAEYLLFWENCLQSSMPVDAFQKELSSSSSQFTIGRENLIYGPIDTQLEKSLMERFLSHGNRDKKRGRYDKYVATKIDDYIYSILDRRYIDPSSILKQAPPRRFLSREAYQCLGSNGFKVARVINGLKDLVLLDGITIGSKHDPKRAQERATHIAYMFFRLKKIKSEISRIEHRSVHSAALIFDDEEPHRDPHAEFAIQVLERETDMLQYASQPSTELTQLVAKSAAHPFHTV